MLGLQTGADSNGSLREPFRRISVLEGIVLARVSGAGVDGYRTALERVQGALS